METKTIAPVTVITYTETTTLKGLMEILNKNIPSEMLEVTKQQQIEITGPNQWNYYGTDGQLDTPFILEIAFPVNKAGTDGKFKFKTLPSFKCVSITHKGSWDSLKNVYEETIPQMAKKGMGLRGNCREIYSVIHGMESDQNITEVQIEFI